MHVEEIQDADKGELMQHAEELFMGFVDDVSV
jgi:hypothetical protein